MRVRRKGGVMRSNTAKRSCAGALMISACLLCASAIAQQTPPQETPKPLAKDTYQRSLQTYEFRKAAGSGPERGREIFYYKCWFCHNEFTKNAPQLTGLYQRGTLLSGLPVNDDTVKDRIRNGGAGMAAYKYTLSEADLTDLVSFVREKCCWDSDAPPLNPRYGAR
jgi:mono/diheme cytochrome c family protein